MNQRWHEWTLRKRAARRQRLGLEPGPLTNLKEIETRLRNLSKLSNGPCSQQSATEKLVRLTSAASLQRDAS